MTDDINAQPDYGDEPPFACSSVAVLDGEAFACGGTPGHAGKHRYLIDWNGQGDLAEPKPARELAAAMGETRELRKVAREFIGMFHGIPGGYGARTSVGRLNRLAREAGVEPPQPGDPLSTVVADELGVPRDRITTLAASLDSDALATAPSKKSQIQEDAARRVREAIG